MIEELQNKHHITHNSHMIALLKWTILKKQRTIEMENVLVDIAQWVFLLTDAVSMKSSSMDIIN